MIPMWIFFSATKGEAEFVAGFRFRLISNVS
jgi:hypothetical protein